ncbi:MAG: type II secretion system GspH family protein [Lentisphaerales bacterium]|nr:type II secretion system GspH family protein [Lentisphaerales bacterium]
MKRTFTLIELLVVIAMIGILMTILLPSLSESRERTKSALCMSNQKQTYVLSNRFMSEH